MANARGGARKGAGRPSLAEKYGGHIAEVHDKIAERLPRLIENLFILADGVTVQERTPEGGTVVFTRPPDRQANVDLMNRIMGKPVERTEVSGLDGGPIEMDAAVRTTAEIEIDEWRRKMQTAAPSSSPNAPRTPPTS